jgi:hypothetical protein
VQVFEKRQNFDTLQYGQIFCAQLCEKDFFNSQKTNLGKLSSEGEKVALWVSVSI